MNRSDLAQHLGRKPRKAEEDALHKALIEHLRLRADKRVVYFHVPNSPRSKATGGRLKAMGMLAGCYDLVFFLPGGQAAVLELKVEGGVVSDAQQDFGERCEAIGVMQAVAWNIDQALGILAAWDIIPRQL